VLFSDVGGSGQMLDHLLLSELAVGGIDHAGDS
jgi:hypothetical protein